MKEFIFIREKIITYSPEEMQQHMADWQQWMVGLAENGSK